MFLDLSHNYDKKSIDFRGMPQSMYGLLFASDKRSIPEVAASEILGRCLHWVNTLAIDYNTLIILDGQRQAAAVTYLNGNGGGNVHEHQLLEQAAQQESMLQALWRLEDLTVWIDHFCSSAVKPLNLESAIQLLQSATRLRNFTLRLDYKNLCCGHDKEMAGLFRVLPKSLERLTVQCRANQTKYMKDQSSGSILPMDTDLETLENLKALYLFHCRTELNNTILKELLLPKGRCPSLEELHVQVSPDAERYRPFSREHDMNKSLARIISSGNGSSGEIDVRPDSNKVPRRWKTMAFKRMDSMYMDNEVVAAILDPRLCTNWENLLVDGCEAFNSTSIQRLLCSSPKLKRFNNLPSTIETSQEDDALPIDAFMLKADDIISSQWVCLELESLKCLIGGILRPEAAERTNGWKLLFDLNNPNLYSMEDSQVVQRRVLAELGRLTQLRELSLGRDGVEVEVDRCHEYECYGDYYCRFAEMDHQLDDETYCQRYMIDFDPGQQHQCLSLTLEDGLDLLVGLKALKIWRLNAWESEKGQRRTTGYTITGLNMTASGRTTFGQSVGISIFRSNGSQR